MPIDYNSIDYRLFRYSNRLHYLESQRPEMFDVLSKEGVWEATFFGRKEIKYYARKGKIVKAADIDKEILDLRQKVDHLLFLKQQDAIKLNPYQAN